MVCRSAHHLVELFQSSGRAFTASFYEAQRQQEAGLALTAGRLNLGSLHCFFDDGQEGQPVLLDLREPQMKHCVIVGSGMVSGKSHRSDLTRAWAIFP